MTMTVCSVDNRYAMLLLLLDCLMQLLLFPNLCLAAFGEMLGKLPNNLDCIWLSKCLFFHLKKYSIKHAPIEN